MIRLPLLCCALSFIALSSRCVAQPDSQGGAEWSLYQNDMLGLRMNYPSHWDTTAHDPRLAFIAAEINPDSLDRFNENLNLSVGKSHGTSLEEAVKLNLNAARQRYQDSVSIESSERTNAHGTRVVTISMILPASGMTISNDANLFTDGEWLYCLTFGGEAEKAEAYCPIWNAIIESIKLK